jgi:hypothetical protein
LDIACRIVNLDQSDPTDHPLTGSFGQLVLFGASKPLPSWNGVMSALVTRLMFNRSRLPVLSYVPILEVQRAWRDGRVSPPEVPVSEPESIILIDDEWDLTLWDSTLVHLVLRELDATESALRAVLDQDTAIARRLRREPGINHRQRAVLAAALADSGATFRIDWHRDVHGVVYATARSDLLDLVERGYLRHVRRGRAFQFTPAPDLRRRLARS